MHNITKIKLFRILLRITYLPSLIILYPLARLRKKSKTGLFFFFDRFSLGGAQRIHLDILKAIPEAEKQIFFTRFSPDTVFHDEFYAVPQSRNQDIHIYCDYLLLRLFSVHYFSFYINRHSTAHVFGSNSTFFYDLLPFIRRDAKKTELLHNFTFGKNGMEFFGLINYHRLTNRIVYDLYTKENIEKQYAQFQIDPVYLQRIRFIEPGVDIPPEKKKLFDQPLKIICAGRGGPQKRIWLVNRIAEYFLEKQLPVVFFFAGTLIRELSEKVKAKSEILGEISDPLKMTAVFAGSNIALLTSLYEGFPMFIKESMANGCIPIVTDLPGYRSHLTDGINCLLIHEIKDEEAIIKEGIEKITGLENNKNLLTRISQSAYAYARDHFSKASFNSSYRKLLVPTSG
jgi:L-malate glycosyltransferase